MKASNWKFHCSDEIYASHSLKNRLKFYPSASRRILEKYRETDHERTSNLSKMTISQSVLHNLSGSHH
jgi:hypothetical protein